MLIITYLRQMARCMRGGLIVVFACFFSIQLAFCQIEEEEADSVRQKISWTPEFNTYLEWNKVVKQNVFLATEIGLNIHKDYRLGIHANYFLGDLIKRVVFPNFYYLDKYMWGPYIGYKINFGNKFHIIPQLKYGFAYMKWTEMEGERFHLEDYYSEIRPEIILNYILFNSVYLRGGLGYTMIQGLNLSGIEEKEINGFSFSLGIGIRIEKK